MLMEGCQNNEGHSGGWAVTLDEVIREAEEDVGC